MHLPDGFINNQISVGLVAVSIGFLAVSFTQVKKSLFKKITVIKNQLALADGFTTESSLSQKSVLSQKGMEKIRLMAVVGSLIFAMQMINFPVVNGTSGHLIGGALVAITLGPWAGLIVISIVLLVQSLIFADGGVLVLGANIFNMGIIATVGGYYLFAFVNKFFKKRIFQFISIGVVAWLSVIFASFFCALEIGWSGTISLNLVLPAMIKIHLLIGLGEALLTYLLIKVLKLKLYEK